jgi:hypothetical protein
MNKIKAAYRLYQANYQSVSPPGLRLLQAKLSRNSN